MKKSNRNQKGIVFNIQKFSIHDGPGIRTVVFFKGCPLRCQWCSNPESQQTKLQILWDQKKCINCYHCIKICPTNAIFLLKGHIHIDLIKCTGCGRCVSECPGNALESAGEVKTVQQVIDIVLQDQVFYEESGGGITLSGGEFLFQPEFAENLLLAAKEEKLHTCCETTGFSNPEFFSKIITLVDHILFDIKHWDSTKHKDGTSVSNDLILANIAYAVRTGKDILPRIPVIPGFNDTLEDVAGFAKLFCAVGIKKCQLLPFHQFGENKYALLDQNYAYAGLPSLHREDLMDYLKAFQDLGINAFF